MEEQEQSQIGAVKTTCPPSETRQLVAADKPRPWQLGAKHGKAPQETPDAAHGRLGQAARCTINFSYCTLHAVQFTLHTAHCMLYT